MIKQVIVIRKFFLNEKGEKFSLRTGKIAAQACHSSIAFIIKRNGQLTEKDQEWIATGQTKICVQVDSEEELNTIAEKAREANLEVHVVIDAGRTEFAGKSTKTCLCIGPNEANQIDKITGHLKLM